MTVQQFSIPVPSPASDAALRDRWTRQIDAGAETFSEADYDRLAVLYADDARELAFVLDARSCDYPVCATCDGDGYVTRELIVGSPASWHGIEVDYAEFACPDCGGADDREPTMYNDDDLDVLYAQTCRDMRQAVLA